MKENDVTQAIGEIARKDPAAVALGKKRWVGYSSEEVKKAMLKARQAKLIKKNK